MALVTCKECKKEFSSDAKACPHCGKRRTSLTTKLFAGVFVFVGVMAFWGMIQGQKASEEAAQKKAEQRAALTPEQRLAEDAAKAKEEKLSAARGACLITLKQSLNDPGSAEIGSTSQWYVEERKNGTILVQPTARAKNAFGAYIQGAWDCVVKPEGKNIQVLSMKQIRP